MVPNLFSIWDQSLRHCMHSSANTQAKREEGPLKMTHHHSPVISHTVLSNKTPTLLPTNTHLWKCMLSCTAQVSECPNYQNNDPIHLVCAGVRTMRTRVPVMRALCACACACSADQMYRVIVTILDQLRYCDFLECLS